MCVVDWPVDLKVFEVQPGSPQLVFEGDSLPIQCIVSNDSPPLINVYWTRQGKPVHTSPSEGIIVDSRRDELAATTTANLK